MTVRALLIEDDETIAEPLAEGLARYGLTIHHVTTGAAGLAGPYDDIVLLDLGLPDMDGIDVCRGIRQVSDVPIIMLTARGEEADRVLGLELGADDYLAKPFSIRELIARIRAVTRRTGRAEPPPADRPAPSAVPFPAPVPFPTPVPFPAPEPVAFAASPQPAVDGPPPAPPLVVDRRTRQVWVGEALISLTPKEFELLALLTEDPGAVYSRQQILDQVWDPHFHGPTKTLDVHIAALRRKLGDPAWIQTLRGVGFRLAVRTAERAPEPRPAPAPAPSAADSWFAAPAFDTA
ncbi:response regulator transcription factor [Streptomyces sp. NBS 14/10]|uniref:response regulator transcription factor n=1 Tax=Streptomyces sp. NBS 14/10 TaxID=1945643 RepID=UPI000B7FDD3A|nr:response regulator transcription factor [Streptomyces sp. NBS 14/10]KAK1183318.1 response regulator transcription factor [Streptomyces sp. NBS 14/10]